MGTVLAIPGRAVRAGLRAAIAGAAVAVVLGLSACGGQATGDRPPAGSSTLTIYSSLPLHGTDRERSRDMVNAIKLALQDAHGRIGKLHVTYVSLDSSTTDAGTWTPDQVLANARQAIRDPNGIAFIGELHSAATALALPLVNAGHMLQVTPTSTYDGLTRPGGTRKGEPERFYPSGKRTFGRVVAPDHVEASALVGYMKEQGIKKLAMLQDRGLEGGGMSDQVQAAAAAQGLDVVDEGQLDARSGDLSGHAGDVAKSGADAFMFAGESDSGAARMYDAVAAADPTVRLFAPSIDGGRPFLRALPADVQSRMRMTEPTLPPRLLDHEATVFLARFRAAFGREPVPDALAAYEATKVVLHSIHAAGDNGNDRDDVVNAFFATRNRHSVLGTYSIDRYGDPSFDTYAGNRVVGSKLVLDKVLKVR